MARTIGIDSVPECAQGILHCDDAQAYDLQQCNHFAPARPVGPSAVNDHHRRSRALTRHDPAKIGVTSTPGHVARTHLMCSLASNPDQPVACESSVWEPFTERR